MLVAVCSDKGSPGSTTTALVLASAWPEDAVVVEADIDGGDLGLHLRDGAGAALPETPTVLTVAIAARGQSEPDPVTRHAHQLSQRVAVIPGAVMAEQAAGVTDWSPLAEALASHERAVFVDVGRLHAGSRLMPIVARADVLVMVARSEPASVIRMRERLSRLAPEVGAMRGSPARLFPVLVAPVRQGRRDLSDLRHLLGTTPASPFLVGSGLLAFDPAAVRRLQCAEDPEGRLARTALMRSAALVAERLAQVGEANERPTTAPVGGGA